MKPKPLKPLEDVLIEYTQMENTAVRLKDTAQLIHQAAWGTHWSEVGPGLVDGAVYACRRVWLYPKRHVHSGIAIMRWTRMWGWQAIHGVIPDGTGRCTIEIWDGRPSLSRAGGKA